MILPTFLKLNLNFVYFFLKFLPTDPKKIVLLSRQKDTPSLDFKLIQAEIAKTHPDYRVVTLTKRLNKNFKSYFTYYFYFYRQMYHLATAKICVIDGYNIVISVLRHKKQLKIFQIWHSLGALKKFGLQALATPQKRKIAKSMRMHRNYDYVISPSPVTTQFYQKAFGYHRKNFLAGNLPRVDFLLSQQKRTRMKIYQKYPELRRRKIILYAPTSREKPHHYQFKTVAAACDLRKYTLIIKPHPSAKQTVNIEGVYNCPEFSALALIQVADFVITDYSAIAIEAAILDKPVFIYAYDLAEYRKYPGLNVNLEREFSGYVFGDAKRLFRKLDSGKYDKKIIRKFRSTYAPEARLGATADLVGTIFRYGGGSSSMPTFHELLQTQQENSRKKLKKRLKTGLTELSKRSLIFRKLLRSALNLYRLARYKLHTLNVDIDEKLVIFSCFNGKAYADSPKAIYEYLRSDRRFRDFRFVWVLRHPEKYKFLSRRRNTTVVKPGSRKYLWALASAKYWVFNFKIGEFLKPKKSQVFIQCWHGTPLKRLGCDLTHFDGELNTAKGMRKRWRIEAKKFSFLLSPSRFASAKFTSAWQLDKIGKTGIIVEQGYPRNDFLFNFSAGDVERIKKHFKIPAGKKVILYAPTYRADQHTSGLGYVYRAELDFEQLKSDLGRDFVVLYRAHYFIKNQAEFRSLKDFVIDVSGADDINELYVVSDLLITDYSSVFFDFANLKRPMIFYMYDYDHYKNESNGFYFDPEKILPGKIVKNQADLTQAIKQVAENFRYDKIYQKFNRRFNYLDDGKATERVVEECFNVQKS